MLAIPETDFVALADFPLRWRFADALYGQPSLDLLRRIRPLAPGAAAALEPRATARCREEGHFGVTFRSDDAPAEVRRRLAQLPPSANTLVVVSWDAQTAAVTDWEVFVAHWDDFCYSASDDVTVIPLAGGWTLCYRHYDVFQFESRPSAA